MSPPRSVPESRDPVWFTSRRGGTVEIAGKHGEVRGKRRRVEIPVEPLRIRIPGEHLVAPEDDEALPGASGGSVRLIDELVQSQVVPVGPDAELAVVVELLDPVERRCALP